jgi:hypothetical protein
MKYVKDSVMCITAFKISYPKNYQIDHHIHVRTSSNVGMSICATSLLCAQCMLLCAIFQLFDSKRSLIRYVLLMFCTFDLLHFDWITYFESSNTHHCIVDVLHLHDLNMEMSVD